MNVTVFYNLMSEWYNITSFHMLLITQPSAGSAGWSARVCEHQEVGVIGARLEAAFHKIYG